MARMVREETRPVCIEEDLVRYDVLCTSVSLTTGNRRTLHMNLCG